MTTTAQWPPRNITLEDLEHLIRLMLSAKWPEEAQLMTVDIEQRLVIKPGGRRSVSFAVGVWTADVGDCEPVVCDGATAAECLTAFEHEGMAEIEEALTT